MAVCKLLCFIIQHTQAFCSGVLIAAVQTLSAINETEDSANQHSCGEYEYANDYRAAAIAIISTSSIAIAYHVVIIIPRICLLSTKHKFFSLCYAFMVSNHNANYIYIYTL